MLFILRLRSLGVHYCEKYPISLSQIIPKGFSRRGQLRLRHLGAVTQAGDGKDFIQDN